MEPKNRKSKIVTRVILAVTAILAVVSIGTAYYFYQIKDVSPKDSSAAEGCGCYFILANSEVTSCSAAKPENAFEFRSGTVNSNGQCSATCDPRTAATIKTSQTAPTILGCEVANFSANPGCIDVAITNSENERLAEGVSPDEAITVKAVFTQPSTVSNTEEDYYTAFSFTLNGEKVEVDKSSAEITGQGGDKRYTVSTQVDDYKGAEKLTVQAFGTSVTSSEVTSTACLRTVSVNQPKVASCTAIDVNLTSGNENPKVDDVWLDLSLVEEPKSVAVKFKLGSSGTVITTKDSLSQLVDGTVIFDNDFLYNTDNFTSSNSFAILNSETSKYDIEAVVVIDGNEIDSEACTTSVTLPSRTPTDEDPNDEDPDPSDEDPDPSDEDPSDEEPSVTSSFLTSKAASRQCVERVAPNNSVKYTIEIENTDSGYQDVLSIKDKLPLGFTYVAGSTEIDGTAVTDDSVVTVTTVGSTQEIVWQRSGGWSIEDDSSMVITFNATATADALTGANLNEVVITPVNTPEDATTLRAEVSITVAQSCTAPQTGLIDSNIAKALLGLMIIGLATLFYRSQLGDKYSEKIATSNAYTGVKLFGLKLTEPRKYFEEKSIHEIEKKRKKTS
jgi:fimbrial isopeptide formation D2 family protein